MANHSGRPDNYVGNKTWDEVMGEDSMPKAKTRKSQPKREPEKNEARKNGGGE